MFPLGSLPKWEVKQLAVENNLQKFAIKRESMGICFIGSRNFQDFIKEVGLRYALHCSYLRKVPQSICL